MRVKHLRPGSGLFLSLLLLGVLIATGLPHHAQAQEEAPDTGLEEPTMEGPPAEEGLVPELPQPGVPQLPFARPALPPAAQPALPGEPPETAGDEEPPPEIEPIEGGEALEGQTSWTIRITAAVRANYVYNDSPESFIIKYRLGVEGKANANTTVMRGDAEISAAVEGFLAKWPTGECKLEVTVPKVPYELTFQRTGEDKGNVALTFKKIITEDWQSRCSFADAPGAKFDTRGDPEKILTRALDKARPPLRSIVTNLGREESSTSFVISKEVIDDAPLGTIEIEGTGVVTITPAGAGT